MKATYFFALLALICALTFAFAADDNKLKGPIIGIDLGTTYSCVSVMHSGSAPEVIPNDQGNRITPSVVAFTDDERLIGDSAKNQASSNPQNTIYDVKRFIGSSFTDSGVQHDIARYPYKGTTKPGDEKPYIAVATNGADKLYAPEAISAYAQG